MRLGTEYVNRTEDAEDKRPGMTYQVVILGLTSNDALFSSCKIIYRVYQSCYEDTKYIDVIIFT